MRIEPGLTLGFALAPARLAGPLADAIAAAGAAAPGYALEVGIAWMADGTIAALEAAKREDAVRRQAIARAIFGGERARRPTSYHILVDLPPGRRAGQVVEDAARAGIALTPAAAFAVAPGHAPNIVRVGLADFGLAEPPVSWSRSPRLSLRATR